MLALLHQFFPYIIIAMGGLVFFTRRPEEQEMLPRLPYLLLLLSFIQPWLCIGIFRNNDIWLFSIMGMLAFALLIARYCSFDEEAWFKVAISWFLGALFLLISLHPTLGLPFPVSTEWVRALTSITAILAIFLWFGVPPLQQGVIDFGSVRSIRWQMLGSTLMKFVLAYFLLVLIQATPWMENLEEFHPMILGSLFIGLAASRLVLRLQTNLFRLLSILSTSFLLSIIASFVFLDYASHLLMGIALVQMPFFAILNQAPMEDHSQRDLWNVSSFFQMHAPLAKTFFNWLRIVLLAEIFVLIALTVKLIFMRSYGLCSLSLFASLASLSVLADKEAFRPWAKALVQE